MFSWPSSLSGLAISAILNDPAFLQSFTKRNRQLLTKRYNFATKFLKAHSIAYVPSNAGFFIWIDLSPFLDHFEGDNPLDRERTMNQALFDGGVHLATSEAFEGEDSGWFRLSFAVNQEILDLGLDRYHFS
jgi:1-aminocyclopropane-1-carboxylate synthase